MGFKVHYSKMMQVWEKWGWNTRSHSWSGENFSNHQNEKVQPEDSVHINPRQNKPSHCRNILNNSGYAIINFSDMFFYLTGIMLHRIYQNFCVCRKSSWGSMKNSKCVCKWSGMLYIYSCLWQNQMLIDHPNKMNKLSILCKDYLKKSLL